MNVEQAVQYNTKKAGKLWKTINLPTPLCYMDPTDDSFAWAVATFQMAAGDVGVDGMLGPNTWRRMLTAEEAITVSSDPVATPQGAEYIIFADQRIEVEGNVNIVTMDEEDSLSFKRDTKKGYYKWHKPIHELVQTNKRYATNLATVHWDAALSAKSCYKILKARGLSSCFGIDNDGTVYQWLDPGKYRGAHAGSTANRASIASFDMSNAVYTKYADRYERTTGVARPLLRTKIHGRKTTLLGMYESQITALLYVLKALAKAAAPGDDALQRQLLAFPLTDGYPVQRVYDGLFSEEYRGWHTHLHITAKKWDVAGLGEQIIALLLSDDMIRAAFPTLDTLFRLDDPKWGAWLSQKRHEWSWPEIFND